jgi:hypothetical protein
MKNRFSLLFLILLLTACSGAHRPTGTLRGHVTIGPLVPVMREGEPTPTPNPAVFEERKVVVHPMDGRIGVIEVDIRPDGTYQVQLAAGTYIIDINHLGIDSAAGLPAEIEVLPGETTVLDIDIDTGIR